MPLLIPARVQTSAMNLGRRVLDRARHKAGAVAHTVNSAAVRVVGAVRAPGAIHAPLRHTIRAAEATVGRRAVQRAAREAKQHLARAKLKPQFLAQLPFQQTPPEALLKNSPYFSSGLAALPLGTPAYVGASPESFLNNWRVRASTLADAGDVTTALRPAKPSPQAVLPGLDILFAPVARAVR